MISGSQNLPNNFEPQWLTKAKTGDSAAFTKLIEVFQKPVYNLCYRMLGNVQDAEDASQESFLRAFKSLKRYDSNRSFSTWLLSITAHYCIDLLRRRRFQIVAIEDLPLLDVPDTGMGLETKVTIKEDSARVRELLDALNPMDRAIVVLYYWYELPYDEICQTLALSTSAVKSRLHRARRRMAEQWMEKIPEYAIAERMAP